MEKSIFLNKANIVVSAFDELSLDTICKINSQNIFDVVEIRLDQLIQENELKTKISSITKPLLLTCRHPKEGGDNNISEPLKRVSIIEPLLSHASAIDIEISTATEMKNLITEAKSKNIQVVLSYHNFETTPNLAELKTIATEAKDKGADIIKIATTTNTIQELMTLLTFSENGSIENLSFMGMGKFGMSSRLVAAQSGSVLNYSAIAETSIEGQWQLAAYREALKLN